MHKDTRGFPAAQHRYRWISEDSVEDVIPTSATVVGDDKLPEEIN